MGEGLFIGAEMTSRQLYHQSPLWHGQQLTKARNLEHTAQLADILQVGEGPFPVTQLV